MSRRQRVTYFLAAVAISLAGVLVFPGHTKAAPPPYYGDDQIRLARSYLAGGEPVQAIAPLLNVLRESTYAGTATGETARWTLAQAYLESGLYGSARRLLEDLSLASGPLRLQALAALTRLELRTGRIEPAFEALAAYRRQATDETERSLLLEAARTAFSHGATEHAQTVFAELASADADAEAEYFLGVLALLDGSAQAAADRFTTVTQKTAPNSDLFDLSVLALGRLYFKAGDYAQAHAWYSTLEEKSPYYDRALYEGAWVELARGETERAQTQLLRLALDRPLSRLLPKARLLYGYLLLEGEAFTQAQQRFASYIAHYGAVNDRIVDLQAHERPAEIYDMLLDNLTGDFSEEARQDIELLAWLREQPQVQEADRLVRGMDNLNRQLFDVMTTLHAVQLLAENTWGEPKSAQRLLARQQELSRSVSGMESELVRTAKRLGARLGGRDALRFQEALTLLSDLDIQRAELAHLGEKTTEKRRDLIHLLQYAEGSRYMQALTMETGRSGRDGMPAADAVNAIFSQMDSNEVRINDARRALAGSSMQVIGTLLDVLEQAYSRAQIAGLRKLHNQLQSAHYELGAVRATLETRRRASAEQMRPHVVRMYAELQEMRGQAATLSVDAQELRGEMTLAAALAINDAVGSLVADAKLGSVDVAWKAREQSVERVRALSALEQNDLEAIGETHRELQAAIRSPASVSGETEAPSRLQPRIEAADRRASAQAQALSEQRIFQARLNRHLRNALEMDRDMARHDATALRFYAPADAPWGNLTGARITVDHRPLTVERGVAEATFLQPGPHTVNILLVFDDGAEEVRVAGSLYYEFVRGRRYRLDLKTDDQGAPAFGIAVEGGKQ